MDEIAIKTIRVICAEMVKKANSGHPGAPLGLAPLCHLLFSRYLKINPKNPKWINRDRFILSNGHACALQYLLLHLCGYNLSLNDLKSFRKYGSKTPGHPEYNVDIGIEITTGPLGQGISAAVGIAIAQKQLSATFNTKENVLFNSKTFVVVGDGDMMEGVSYEAFSLAGHLKLSNLIVFYDDNSITIDGSTDLSFTENIEMRFKSYGFKVLICKECDKGLEELETVVKSSLKEKEQPVLVIVKTTIGYGSIKQGTSSVHGSPLSKEDIEQMKTNFGFSLEKDFYIPEEVYSLYSKVKERGILLENEWNQRLEEYRKKQPKLWKSIQKRIFSNCDISWKEKLPLFETENIATREASSIVLNQIAKSLEEFIGGSADLSPSNLTKWKDSVTFSKKNYKGRYIHFGVREHAMFSIANGISSHGLFIPFVSTFLNFLTYGWGAVRLSALSGHHVLYIMTHDSIGVGEDGPTHQPIEVLSALRSLPGIVTLRPADGNEVVGSYIEMFSNRTMPYVLCLSRQKTPSLKGTNKEKCRKGAYVVHIPFKERNDCILVSTGTEVAICIDTSLFLEQNGFSVTVVSMMSTELFEKQSLEYRRSVLIPGKLVISVEAMSTFGWCRYSHYQIGIDSFGASGEYKEIYKQKGIDPFQIAQKVSNEIKRSKKEVIPILPVLREE